jgi:hypothetical protein
MNSLTDLLIVYFCSATFAIFTSLSFKVSFTLDFMSAIKILLTCIGDLLGYSYILYRQILISFGLIHFYNLIFLPLSRQFFLFRPNHQQLFNQCPSHSYLFLTSFSNSA